MRQLQLHVFLPVLLAEAGCLAIDRDPVASYARHSRRLTLFRRLLEAHVAQSGKSKWLSPRREALLETDTLSNFDHRNFLCRCSPSLSDRSRSRATKSGPSSLAGRSAPNPHATA